MGRRDKSDNGCTGNESTHKPGMDSLENCFEAGYKYICLNARSIVNKRNELNIIVEDIDLRIIGITEKWANKDTLDAESGLTA